MQSTDSVIHNKINDRVAKGIASRFVDSLLNTVFHDPSSIPIYSFYWDDLSAELVKKVGLVTNTLTSLYQVTDLEYLKIITQRIKVDYFKNSLAITLQTKGLITDEYRRSLELIFLESNLRVEFPDTNSCIITLR
jgi:hypothetical protein